MHDIEILEDGTASMFSGEGIMPWHRLVEPVEGLLTAKEALKKAHLDWEVIKEPISFGADNQSFPGWHATVRKHDRKPLGIVSDGYHIFQNHEAFDFMDIVTATGEAKYTSAGSLAGGKKIFICVKIGDRFMVAGEDAHDLYGLMFNSFHGKESFTIATTAIRAVCANTVTLGLRTAKTKWTIRHKSSFEGKAQDARDTLKISFKYVEAFQKEVEKMMQIQIDKDKFNKIVEQIVPESKFQHDKDVAQLMDIFENETTVNDTNAKGTGWGAFNAITFFGDHRKRYVTDESRFKSITSEGYAEKMRNKAHGLILAA
jgi:phage/plasmid-like protein (TIGR03299 family)